MVSLTLSTLPPIFFAAAGDPSPTAPLIFGNPKPLAPCSVRCSTRRPTKSLAFASAPPSGVAVDEEDDSSPERYLGDTKIADFGRLNWDSDYKGCRLQTAVVGYRKRSPSPSPSLRVRAGGFKDRKRSLSPPPSLRVDLVSLIHIADKEYFTTLQEELRQYDCVLYEMIAHREDLEEGLETQDPSIFNFVGFIAPIFGLRWQTSCLNYSSPNWFHADIDMETYWKLQQEKGKNSFTSIVDMVSQHQKQAPDGIGWRSKLWAHRFLMGRSAFGTLGDQASDYAQLEALYKLDFASAIKIYVAKISNMITTMNADMKSAFVGERNVAATKALRKAITDGHNKIAILYGCGHMPDLGRRLQEEFELVPSDDVRWKTAWTIRIRELDTSSSPFLQTTVNALGWFTILLVQAADLTIFLMKLAFAGLLVLTLQIFEEILHAILYVILLIFSPESLDSVRGGKKPKI